ncbi:MHS family proline/betaine transporter-like MFS transporter [Williamsia muralis]|uniref:MHS family proline/betaine transporter-like MFS transporter n=1 Tax=Williamsia marianensis TaxID=85044 RepID=A0A495KAC5_WILMA|nr:MFS transporter [Williamsia muralis]RKR97439.1 MHS family proline/betaine transporter-like MFS transporter [Williamsia muralis]
MSSNVEDSAEHVRVQDSRQLTRTRRRALLAASTGNFVEWFDFTIYGFMAVTLADVFFPPDSGGSALLAVFAVYGSAFLARPAGALFFGTMGDRLGRRGSLSLAIGLMGVATAAIGLLPSYATIGAAAPALLLACRLIQGFSAGGEFAGAATFAVEHAPPGRRPLYLAIFAGSTSLGLVGATVTILAYRSMGAEAFDGGGWRWPFLIGGALAIAGLLLRLGVEETPVFEAVSAQDQKTTRRFPLRELLIQQRRNLMTLFAFFACLGVLNHMMLGYMPTYLVKSAGISTNTALVLTTIAMVIPVPVVIALSGLIENVGRRPFVRLGAVGTTIALIPCYLLIGTGNLFVIGTALAILMMGASMLTTGLLPILELLPGKVRYVGTAVPYNVAYAIFAGTAPLVCQALVDSTGSHLAPAFYGTAIALIACPFIFRGIPETKGADLRTGLRQP